MKATDSEDQTHGAGDSPSLREKRVKATYSEDQTHGAGDMKREINIVLLSDEGELSEEFPCLYSKKKRSLT